MLFQKGFDAPSTLLGISSEQLERSGLSIPPAVELSNALKQARSSDPDDIKQLAAFARQAMESKTDKKDMSRASSQWAQELVAALGIVVKTEPINNDTVANMPEPPGYSSWQATNTAGDTVPISEHQGTPGARNWFRNHFLSSDDLGKKGYTCELTTGQFLPTLKAGGKACTGKGDMVIGQKKAIDYADSVYEQVPGLIELKTNVYRIKVGHIILELTAFSMVSRLSEGLLSWQATATQNGGWLGSRITTRSVVETMSVVKNVGWISKKCC